MFIHKTVDYYITSTPQISIRLHTPAISKVAGVFYIQKPKFRDVNTALDFCPVILGITGRLLHLVILVDG